jgi:hypothetical protein
MIGILLRGSINESIVGESATIPLTCSFLIRFSATSHIVNPHILRRYPWTGGTLPAVGSVYFFQVHPIQ